MDSGKRKVLLMGKSGAGKSSMRYIIFNSSGTFSTPGASRHQRDFSSDSPPQDQDGRFFGGSPDGDSPPREFTNDYSEAPVIIPTDLSLIQPTPLIDTSNLRFLGSLKLNLWDCGGQDNLMDSYLESVESNIFLGVSALIYIFDLDSPTFSTDDRSYFERCLRKLFVSAAEETRARSKTRGGSAPQDTEGPNVFVLLHKTDLLIKAKKAELIDIRRQEVIGWIRGVEGDLHMSARDGLLRGFGVFRGVWTTTIWDESLYEAWSSIVSTLIPNLASISGDLEVFRSHYDAVEVVLFERTTWLVITRVGLDDAAAISSISGPSGAPIVGALAGAALRSKRKTRYEKISGGVKKFKREVRKAGMKLDFGGLEISRDGFNLILTPFTEDTYIMVVADSAVEHPGSRSQSIREGIQQVREYFQGKYNTRSATGGF